MNRTLRILLGISTYGLSTVLASGNIYAYTGSHGVIHLTNIRQGNNRYHLVMHTSTIPVALARKQYNPVTRMELQPAVNQAARRFGLSTALINAVITVESGFNAGAVSPKGAMGLMQLMPSTAARFDVQNVFSPRENINGGSAYLAELLRRFGGNLRLALAAYNAGSRAVIQAGYHIPPFEETQNYVPLVMNYYRRYLDNPGHTVGQSSLAASWTPPLVIHLSSP